MWDFKIFKIHLYCILLSRKKNDGVKVDINKMFLTFPYKKLLIPKDSNINDVINENCPQHLLITSNNINQLLIIIVT